jgi:hypothetical protein
MLRRRQFMARAGLLDVIFVFFLKEPDSKKKKPMAKQASRQLWDSTDLAVSIDHPRALDTWKQPYVTRKI